MLDSVKNLFKEGWKYYQEMCSHMYDGYHNF